MPTYEYRCANGHMFELFQRMSEPAVDSCPQCGAPAERLLSAGAGLLFKGSGFYITDYRSDAYKKAAAKDGGSGSGSGSGSDSGSGSGSGSGADGGSKQSGGSDKGSSSGGTASGSGSS